MPPRRIAADDRRFDDQRFPLPRRAQRAVHDGSSLRIDGAAAGDGSGRCDRARRRRVDRPRETGKQLVASSAGTNAPARVPGRPPAPGRATGIRQTGAPRAVRRRRRDGEEGAAGGCGRRVPRSNQPDAAPARRRARAGRCSARRAHEHRHLVERHAAHGLLEDVRAISTHSRPSPGAEKETHVAGGLAHRRLAGGEQVAAQRHEIGIALLLEQLRFEAKRLEPLQRGDVAEGDRDRGPRR